MTPKGHGASTPPNDDDLGIDPKSAVPWFPHSRTVPFVLVRVSDQHAKSWARNLGPVVRRSYVSDDTVNQRVDATGYDAQTIIAAKLPDAGSTMAGDFGEIIVSLYQVTRELPAIAIGPRKLRLKQDRTKPAPYSDVVHFVVPLWPSSSTLDVLLCSEVKTKSTNGDSDPITSAIADSSKDRTSRLARTLVWLRERALSESLGDVTIKHLERFINATSHPAATKHFRAVAVICGSLVDGELRNAPTAPNATCTLVVISVPDLHTTYTSVFEAAKKAVPAVTIVAPAASRK